MKYLHNISILHALGFFILFFSFVYFVLITVHPPMAENHNTGEIKTALIGFDSAIIGYFFGASRSNNHKSLP